MPIRQKDIAKHLRISDAFLSEILSGKSEPGKATCKKMGRFANRPWTDFMVMPPEQVRKVLFAAAEQRVVA